jgi:hypothetical protein
MPVPNELRTGVGPRDPLPTTKRGTLLRSLVGGSRENLRVLLATSFRLRVDERGDKFFEFCHPALQFPHFLGIR